MSYCQWILKERHVIELETYDTSHSQTRAIVWLEKKDIFFLSNKRLDPRLNKDCWFYDKSSRVFLLRADHFANT